MDIEDAFKVVGRFGRFQIFVSVVIFVTNIVYGCQMVLMVIVGATPNPDVPSEANLTTIVTEWNLYDDQWIIDLITSLFMVGFAVGVMLFGQLSDLYGRKNLFLLNFSLCLIFAFCTTFCTNWKTFAVMRIFTGMFGGGSGHILFTLMLENIGKNKWASTGMIFQTFFSVGMMLLSLMAYTLQNWRKVCIASSSFAIVLLPIYIFIVPESARWLYYVGKVEKAEKVLHYIATKNGVNISRSDILLSSVNDNRHTPEQSLRKYSIIDLFKIRKLAIYAICSFYAWFACSFVYYGLTFDASILSPNIYVACLLSGVIEVPAIILSLFLMKSKWLGRKGSLIMLTAISVFSNIGLLFADALKSEYLSTLETVFGLSNKLAVAGVFGILYVYVSEIFPTQLRVVAIGGSSMFARVGAIISPFVPLLVTTASYLPYVVFGVITTLSAMSALFLPETLNKRIPDMSDFTSEHDRCQPFENKGVLAHTAPYEDDPKDEKECLLKTNSRTRVIV